MNDPARQACLVGVDPSQVRIGMAVEVFFEHMSDELIVPRLKPRP